VSTNVPTTHGTFQMRAYRDLVTSAEHVAIIGALPDGSLPADGALVRVHSECLTGEAFGSLKCECGPQLDAALDTIAAEGGVVIYLRGHEGRGIGLINKLKAYRLQEDGLDTLDANLALGLPADSRAYGGAAGILADLGITRVRLLSNNPEKRRQLEEHGITVDSLVPLVVGISAQNAGYLDTKRDRMGHQLPERAPAQAPERAQAADAAAS
jgi:3,4-dihydroxy 2-butanone 4-phosphate synthase/GTP cyclohydrolase II